MTSDNSNIQNDGQAVTHRAAFGTNFFWRGAGRGARVQVITLILSIQSFQSIQRRADARRSDKGRSIQRAQVRERKGLLAEAAAMADYAAGRVQAGGIDGGQLDHWAFKRAVSARDRARARANETRAKSALLAKCAASQRADVAQRRGVAPAHKVANTLPMVAGAGALWERKDQAARAQRLADLAGRGLPPAVAGRNFSLWLDKLAAAAAWAAAGKFGRVSSTSRDEAGLAARAAMVAAMAQGGQFRPEVADTLARRARVKTSLRRIAKRAATRSLMGDLTGGQTGATAGLRGIRRETVETLDGIVRGGTDDDVLPIARNRARALDLVLAVRRARTEYLGTVRPGAARRGWRGQLALVIRRYWRISRVLSAVAQGDSLDLACVRAGFTWDALKRTSSGWSKAFDESGLRALLCVHTGQAGRRGSIGQDTKRGMV